MYAIRQQSEQLITTKQDKGQTGMHFRNTFVPGTEQKPRVTTSHLQKQNTATLNSSKINTNNVHLIKQ